MADEHSTRTERKFPLVYEKLIPIVLIILGILVVGMVALTIGVALGW